MCACFKMALGNCFVIFSVEDGRGLERKQTTSTFVKFMLGGDD